MFRLLKASEGVTMQECNAFKTKGSNFKATEEAAKTSSRLASPASKCHLGLRPMRCGGRRTVDAQVGKDGDNIINKGMKQIL
ncbi:hypothetical protein SUGI_0603270 [Cryptomeria japonica]|nr:hypothetical protein SUGI_0603270 [Cryptomeria japonica]